MRFKVFLLQSIFVLCFYRSLVNYHHHRSDGDHVERHINLWKLRNDSSGVSAVLYPNYYCSSPKRTTALTPSMMSSAKLTLTSKKPQEHITPRKPVKECYCYPEVRKVNLRSSKTRQKVTSPCHQCRSQLQPVEEIKTALTSPISCETYRRVQKIDYTPRSQFLRNVQSRLCEWKSEGQGDCSPTCPRSSSYHRIMASARLHDTDFDQETALSKEDKRVDGQESLTTPKVAPANSIVSNSDTVICTSNKEIRTSSSRRRCKPALRKTIFSKKPTSRSPTRDERTSCEYDCRCCCRDELEGTARCVRDKREKKANLPRYHERRIRRTHSKCEGDAVIDDALTDSSLDREVKDLRNFREQNYFETHGSNHTLASSRSSGSLKQYLLNERLFPEPVGKIHKQDLVVSMPPCATTGKKRIHYFPRHVVRQEKSVYNTNYRRKRHQSCPLTGHAVDLGILKVRPPLNSLALKHQKKAP